MEAALRQSEEECPNEVSAILLRGAVRRANRHCNV
jgi:hypothetical protein